MLGKGVERDLKKLNLKNDLEEVFNEMAQHIRFSSCTQGEFDREARIADIVISHKNQRTNELTN